MSDLLKKTGNIQEKKKEEIEEEKVDGKKVSEEEIEEAERNRQRIYEIEKILGRHEKEKEMKQKRNSTLIKYFSIGTNMIYTLCLPIFIMLGGYMLLEKYIFKGRQPLVLVIFLIIGAFSGYWTLIKQLRNLK